MRNKASTLSCLKQGLQTNMYDSPQHQIQPHYFTAPAPIATTSPFSSQRSVMPAAVTFSLKWAARSKFHVFLPVYQACDPSSYFPSRKVSSLNSHLLGSTTRLPAFLKSCIRNDSPSLSAIIGRLKYKPDPKSHSSLLQRF